MTKIHKKMNKFNDSIVLRLVSCFLPFQQVVTTLSLVNKNFQKQIQKKDFHNLRTELSFRFNFTEKYVYLNQKFDRLCFIINNMNKKISLKINNLFSTGYQNHNFYCFLLKKWSSKQSLIVHILNKINDAESIRYKGGFSNMKYNGYGICTNIHDGEDLYRRGDNYSKDITEGYFTNDLLNGIGSVSNSIYHSNTIYLGYFKNNESSGFGICEYVNYTNNYSNNYSEIYKGMYVDNQQKGDFIRETRNSKEINYKNNSIILEKNISFKKSDLTLDYILEKDDFLNRFVLNELKKESFELKISKFNEIYEEYKNEIDVTSVSNIKITEKLYEDTLALCTQKIKKLQIEHDEHIKQKIIELEHLKHNFIVTNKENLDSLEKLKLEYKTNISNRLLNII